MKLLNRGFYLYKIYIFCAYKFPKMNLEIFSRIFLNTQGNCTKIAAEVYINVSKV